MPKLMICVPYSVDQTEPSRPIRELVEFPDSVEECEAVLARLFKEHVCAEIAGQEDLVYEYGGKSDDYGDITVSHEDEVFMFVTVVEG